MFEEEKNTEDFSFLELSTTAVYGLNIMSDLKSVIWLWNLNSDIFKIRCVINSTTHWICVFVYFCIYAFVYLCNPRHLHSAVERIYRSAARFAMQSL